MAAEIRHLSATIPAGTPTTAPVLVSIAMPVRVVRRIHWKVPRGPAGLFGWLLAMGGAAVLPQPAGTYVIADGQAGTWETASLPDSGAWQVKGYNTGTHPHTVYLVFEVDLPARDRQLGPLIHPHELAPVPDLSRAGPPVLPRPWPS